MSCCIKYHDIAVKYDEKINVLILLVVCNLYDDLRHNLFFEISKFVDNFHTLDIDTKFVKLMTCLDIQHYFCKILNKFYFRRKLFSQ